MIDIKDLKLGDTISVILNGHYVAGEVTYLDIEEKPGSPMSDERPGKIKIKFLELFWEREYPDRGCEIYQAWIDENPDKYNVINREDAIKKAYETASTDDKLAQLARDLHAEANKLYLNYSPYSEVERIAKELDKIVEERKNNRI